MPEEGLYRNFSEIVQRVGDSRLRIYVYHIPPVAQVGITLSLVERLLRQYPGIIAGMKDSSGDWNNTKSFLDAYATAGFDVFAGSESFLLANMCNGGAGCISATANVNPAAIDRLYREWRNADADAQQEALNKVRNAVGTYVMIPALKATIAHYAGDADWFTVRPPLIELTADEQKVVIEKLRGLAFEMPGLREASRVTTPA